MKPEEVRILSGIKSIGCAVYKNRLIEQLFQVFTSICEAEGLIQQIWKSLHPDLLNSHQPVDQGES